MQWVYQEPGENCPRKVFEASIGLPDLWLESCYVTGQRPGLAVHYECGW